MTRVLVFRPEEEDKEPKEVVTDNVSKNSIPDNNLTIIIAMTIQEIMAETVKALVGVNATIGIRMRKMIAVMIKIVRMGMFNGKDSQKRKKFAAKTMIKKTKTVQRATMKISRGN